MLYGVVRWMEPLEALTSTFRGPLPPRLCPPPDFRPTSSPSTNVSALPSLNPPINAWLNNLQCIDDYQSHIINSHPVTTGAPATIPLPALIADIEARRAPSTTAQGTTVVSDDSKALNKVQS